MRKLPIKKQYESGKTETILLSIPSRAEEIPLEIGVSWKHRNIRDRLYLMKHGLDSQYILHLCNTLTDFFVGFNKKVEFTDILGIPKGSNSEHIAYLEGNPVEQLKNSLYNLYALIEKVFESYEPTLPESAEKKSAFFLYNDKQWAIPYIKRDFLNGREIPKEYPTGQAIDLREMSARYRDFTLNVLKEAVPEIDLKKDYPILNEEQLGKVIDAEYEETLKMVALLTYESYPLMLHGNDSLIGQRAVTFAGLNWATVCQIRFFLSSGKSYWKGTHN